MDVLAWLVADLMLVVCGLALLVVLGAILLGLFAITSDANSKRAAAFVERLWERLGE